jgi:hypothetical protein
LRAWIKNGSVRAVRPGRSLFVPLTEIERLECGETVPPNVAPAPSAAAVPAQTEGTAAA